MAVFDADGNLVSTLAEAVAPPDEHEEEEAALPESFEAIPSPGQVIVLRKGVEKFMRHKDGTPMKGMNGKLIEKSIGQIQDEERSNIIAIVARVGDDTGDGPLQAAWFGKGDRVVIAPHVFTEVTLSSTESVWVGPFAGVKMVLKPTSSATEN